MAIFTDEARPGFHPHFDHKSAMVVTRSLAVEGGMLSNLAFIPLSQDPKESPLPLDGLSLQSPPPEEKVRKCPNTGGGGESGKKTTTESCGGARPRTRNHFSFISPGGVGGGQGNGDDEDRPPTDYKKKRLNCDRKQMLTVDRTKWGRFKDFYTDQGGATGYRLDGNKKKSNMGKDECDASMAEQADLLRREQTNHECPRDRVIYSNLHGNIVAFTQRLYGLWRDGSFITPGMSEGVIFNRNLTLNNQNQYRFGEEFTPFAELGRGDFGITRACMDWRSGMKIATKEIPRERFLPFEVLLLAKVKSPFIVQFLGATAERSALFLHMELVDNALPLEYLAGEGAFLLSGQDTIVDMSFQLLAALDCLSLCNVLHRDLTCRNVLLTTAYRIKVIDFNLAVPAPYEQTSMPVGDIHYLAPEVTDRLSTLNCSSDLWSCGIIIISLLRGLPKNDNCERLALADFHPLNCRHLSHCHPALLDLLQHMLTPDPYTRPLPRDLVNHQVFTDGLREELEAYPARNESDSPDVAVVGGEDDDDITKMFRQLYLREGALYASPPEGAREQNVPPQDRPGREQHGVADISDCPMGREPPPSVDSSVNALFSKECPGLSKGQQMESVDNNTVGNPIKVSPSKECVTGTSTDLHGPRPLSGFGAYEECGDYGEREPTSTEVNQRSLIRDESDCKAVVNSLRSRKERRSKSSRIHLAVAFSSNHQTPGVQQKGLDDENVEVANGRENTQGGRRLDATVGASGGGENSTGGFNTSNRGTTKDPGSSRAAGILQIEEEASSNVWGDSPMFTHRSNVAELKETTGPLFSGAVGGVLDKFYFQESAPQNSIERDFERMEIWEQLDVNACVPPLSAHYEARGPNTEPIEGGREEAVVESLGHVESTVPSHVVNPYSSEQNLCDGPYQYPEEWLHGVCDIQQSTEDQTAGDESNGPLQSHESSYRGANQDEEALASEILIDQLSMETDPDLQDRVYQHIASGGSTEPSLT